MNKLKNFLAFKGSESCLDYTTPYGLFIWYISAPGHESNLVFKYKTSQDGYDSYNDFQNQYHNYAYLNNKTSATNHTISTDAYDEDKAIYFQYTPWGGWWTSTEHSHAKRIHYLKIKNRTPENEAQAGKSLCPI